jgi:hypothetical protein
MQLWGSCDSGRFSLAAENGPPLERPIEGNVAESLVTAAVCNYDEQSASLSSFKVHGRINCMDQPGSTASPPPGTSVTHDRVIANDTRSCLPIRNAVPRKRYRFRALSARARSHSEMRVLQLIEQVWRSRENFGKQADNEPKRERERERERFHSPPKLGSNSEEHTAASILYKQY